MDEKLQKIIEFVKNSDLDETIKGILIRDLESEGITEFLKEQVLAYCARTKEEIQRVREELEKQTNPAQ